MSDTKQMLSEVLLNMLIMTRKLNTLTERIDAMAIDTSNLVREVSEMKAAIQGALDGLNAAKANLEAALAEAGVAQGVIDAAAADLDAAAKPLEALVTPAAPAA